MRIATVTVRELRTNCGQEFSKARNRTLERFKVFSRKQKQKETLRQFLHKLAGLTAKCEFGQQTQSLVMDTFIQNMNNKIVQDQLCTEPKADSEEAFRFALAYKEGVNQHKTYEGRNAYKKIKQEPVFVANERKIPCTRCGLEYTNGLSAECKAKHELCRNCALLSHFPRMRRGRVRNNHQAGLGNVDLVERYDDQSDARRETQEDNVVASFRK